MASAWFEYKGINSLDMYLTIENDISFFSPEADVEFIEVLGRDGELAIDRKRLKGGPMPFPVRLRLPEGHTVDEAATKISEWLKNDIGWYPLRFSGSPGYEYEAILTERFDIQETLRTYGKTVIPFRLKPYKYRVGANDPMELQNGAILFNSEKRPAAPLIRIEGNGDIALQNNGEDWLVLRSVDGSITIDSKAMSIYKGARTEFDKMNGNLRPLFPLLNPGENEITWTGNVTKLEITPRWEAVT